MALEIVIHEHIDEVTEEMEKKIALALSKVGFKAEDHVKALAPVDTGRLRASITHLVDDRSVTIGTGVKYAKYQEAGTSRMKAQPFLRPGILDNLDEYKNIIHNELKG